MNSAEPASSQGTARGDAISDTTSAMPNDRRFPVDLGEKVSTVEKRKTALTTVGGYRPTWKERIEDWRTYLGPILAGAFLLGVGGWYVFFHVLPKQAEKQRRVAQAPALVEAQQKLADNISAWEAQYQRSATGGVEDPALQGALNQLIERLRELMKQASLADPAQLRRLSELETTRDSIQSRQAAARSVTAENESGTARQAGDRAAALTNLREALQLRRAANSTATNANERDVVRETRLQTTLEEMECAPLLAAITAAHQRADAAIAAERSDDVLKALQEERAARLQIIQRFPTSRLADNAALERLDEKIASTRAMELVGQINARERESDRAAGTGNVTASAEALAAAGELQRQLNTTFPKSRFVSTARVEEFETRRQTVLASAPLGQVATLDREVAEALRQGRLIGITDRLSAAVNLLSEVATKFPRGVSGDESLRRRITFLWLKRDDLAGILSDVRARLVAFPGQPALRVFSTEVSQALYERVMNDNPSRTAGPALPVESVTWDEAREFCRRMSWVLGYSARLPFENEFVALFAARGESAWTAETSSSHTRVVGQGTAGRAGIHDIAGNVAEWLQRTSDIGGTAPVGGGGFSDAQRAVERSPIAAAGKRERARHVGFRFVVENPR